MSLKEYKSGQAFSGVIGRTSISPVMTQEDYHAPFAFTGTVKKVMVDVSSEAIEDKAAKMRMYLARQ